MDQIIEDQVNDQNIEMIQYKYVSLHIKEFHRLIAKFLPSSSSSVLYMKFIFTYVT